MRVVSNTSPISNLAIIGRLDLLQRRYEVVHIPNDVAMELSALSHPSAKAIINTAITKGWLVVENVPRPFAAKLPFPLDIGETSAIELAAQTKADILLIDERRGREAARQLGLSVGGVLGELLHAKKAGWIPAVLGEMDRLRVLAGFFIDPEIKKFILSQAGE